MNIHKRKMRDRYHICVCSTLGEPGVRCGGVRPVGELCTYAIVRNEIQPYLIPFRKIVTSILGREIERRAILKLNEPRSPCLPARALQSGFAGG